MTQIDLHFNIILEVIHLMFTLYFEFDQECLEHIFIIYFYWLIFHILLNHSVCLYISKSTNEIVLILPIKTVNRIILNIVLKYLFFTEIIEPFLILRTHFQILEIYTDFVLVIRFDLIIINGLLIVFSMNIELVILNIDRWHNSTIIIIDLTVLIPILLIIIFPIKVFTFNILLIITGLLWICIIYYKLNIINIMTSIIVSNYHFYQLLLQIYYFI